MCLSPPLRLSSGRRVSRFWHHTASTVTAGERSDVSNAPDDVMQLSGVVRHRVTKLERERQTDRETETDMDRDRQTERQTDRGREREVGRDPHKKEKKKEEARTR